MFFATRPSVSTINQFLRDSERLPLSYEPIGILRRDAGSAVVEDAVLTIGRGRADFDRARAALRAWKQFEIGWVETFPHGAPTRVGTVVAVLIRHLGFWSLNGCRVVYGLDAVERDDSFGYAYGTLTNHAESGEELFEVSIDSRTDDVSYRIRATSWPQALLAHVGQPVVRLLQARFRAHSGAAMQRATRSAA